MCIASPLASVPEGGAAVEPPAVVDAGSAEGAAEAAFAAVEGIGAGAAPGDSTLADGADGVVGGTGSVAGASETVAGGVVSRTGGVVTVTGGVVTVTGGSVTVTGRSVTGWVTRGNGTPTVTRGVVIGSGVTGVPTAAGVTVARTPELLALTFAVGRTTRSGAENALAAADPAPLTDPAVTPGNRSLAEADVGAIDMTTAAAPPRIAPRFRARDATPWWRMNQFVPRRRGG